MPEPGTAPASHSHPAASSRTLFRTVEHPNLPILAKVAGKAEFYGLGTDTVHTTTSTYGITGKHGTGAYALDLLCTTRGCPAKFGVLSRCRWPWSSGA